MIAHGFLDHPLEPQYGDRHIYNVPPLFPYIVSLSFAIFGESTVAARAPSTLFGAGTILATYFLGHRVFRDQTVAAGGPACSARSHTSCFTAGAHRRTWRCCGSSQAAYTQS